MFVQREGLVCLLKNKNIEFGLFLIKIGQFSATLGSFSSHSMDFLALPPVFFYGHP